MTDSAANYPTTDDYQEKRRISSGQGQLNVRYEKIIRRSYRENDLEPFFISQIMQAIKAGSLDTPQAIRAAALCLLQCGI